MGGIRPSGGSTTKDVRRVLITFVPRSYHASLYARPTSAAAPPSRRSALLRSTVSFLCSIPVSLGKAPPLGGREYRRVCASLARLLAKVSIEHFFRKFRTFIFQDLCILFDAPVQRHADLPRPREYFRIFNRRFVC